MPVFFVTADQIRDRRVIITGPLLNHLRASLRVRVGEQFWTSDERRRRYLVQVTDLNRLELRGHILEERVGPPSSGPGIVLGQALLKGDRMDLVIQKATELGAVSLVPLIASRVIIQPRAARLMAQQARWQRIALEAAQQAERWEVPTVHAPCEATAFFAGHTMGSRNLILKERGPGERLTSITLPQSPDSRVILAVGPEGGWTTEEFDRALACGFTPVTLGERILRAETASLAALSVLQSRLGELG